MTEQDEPRPDAAGADGLDGADAADTHETTWLTPDPDTVRLGDRPTTVDPTVPPAPVAPPAPAAPAGWTSPTAPTPAAAAPPPAPPSYSPPPAAAWQQTPPPPAPPSPPPPPPPPGAWQQAAPMGAPGRPEWTGAALPGVAGWGAVPLAPKPGVVPLRPLGLGEILDGAISYIRRDPRTVLGISTVIALVIALAQFVVTLLTTGTLLDQLESAGTTEDMLVTQIAGSTTSNAIPSLLSFFLNIVAVGMLTVVMGQAVLGRRVTAREAWDRTSAAFWRLLGVTVLVVLATVGVVALGAGVGALIGAVLGQGVGAIAGGVLLGLAAVPVAVWLYVRWLVAPAAVVLERAGVITSMRRSAALARGAWWRLFGIYLLASIIATVVSSVVAVPLGLLGGLVPLITGPDSAALWIALATALATLVGSIVTIPFTAGVVTLLYIDRRIRREALDIELQRASGTGGAPGMTGAAS